MTLPQVISYLFITLAVVASVAVLFTRNVFYGALLLLISLLSIAGLYVLLFAEFVAVTQILIYAGGVLILIIFGIMLTSKIAGKALTVKNNKWFSGLLVGALIFTTLFYFLSKEQFPSIAQSSIPAGEPDVVQGIGVNLMTDYLLPFEIAGVLLLLALIGSAVVASETKKEA